MWRERGNKTCVGCALAGKGCSQEVPGVGGVCDPPDGRGMGVPHISGTVVPVIHLGGWDGEGEVPEFSAHLKHIRETLSS